MRALGSNIKSHLRSEARSMFVRIGGQDPWIVKALECSLPSISYRERLELQGNDWSKVHRDRTESVLVLMSRYRRLRSLQICSFRTAKSDPTFEALTSNRF
jgi:hypothetical protein